MDPFLTGLHFVPTGGTHLDISREYTTKNLFDFLARHFHPVCLCGFSLLIFVPRGRTSLRNAFKILLQFLSLQFAFSFADTTRSFIHSPVQLLSLSSIQRSAFFFPVRRSPFFFVFEFSRLDVARRVA